MKSRDRSGGLSLLEILIAVVLLSLGLLGMFSALLGGQQVDALSREKTHALHAANTQMDEALASTWATLSSRNNTTFDVTFATAGGTSSLKTAADRSKPGLVTVSDTAKADLRRVEVSVKWTSRIGSEVEIVLRSLVARH